MPSKNISTGAKMTKPRSMTSKKAKLLENGLQTKSCVKDLINTSTHASITITCITIDESPLILNSILCFNTSSTYRQYRERTRIRGIITLKQQRQQERKLLGREIRSIIFVVEMLSVLLMSASLHFVQRVIR